MLKNVRHISPQGKRILLDRFDELMAEYDDTCKPRRSCFAGGRSGRDDEINMLCNEWGVTRKTLRLWSKNDREM